MAVKAQNSRSNFLTAVVGVSTESIGATFPFAEIIIELHYLIFAVAKYLVVLEEPWTVEV